jgi:hypothetical protein
MLRRELPPPPQLLLQPPPDAFFGKPLQENRTEDASKTIKRRGLLDFIVYPTLDESDGCAARNNPDLDPRAQI